jgi:hypothetical protein
MDIFPLTSFICLYELFVLTTYNINIINKNNNNDILFTFCINVIKL